MARKKAAGSCEKAIREYFGGVLDGTITACAKMQQVAVIVLRRAHVLFSATALPKKFELGAKAAGMRSFAPQLLHTRST